MSSLKKYGLIFVCLVNVLLANIVSANAQELKDGADIINLVLGDRPAKPFVPFTSSEMKELADEDPDDELSIDMTTGGKTYLGIDLKGKNTELFTIEIGEYVVLANELEKQITPYGYSMRDDSFEQLPVDIYELFNDPEVMQKRLLDALELYAKEELLRRLDAIDPGQCPQIDVDKLVSKFNERVIGGVENKHDKLTGKLFRLKSGDLVKFDEYIRTLNNTNKIFCALGYSIYSTMGFEINEVNGFSQINIDSIFPAFGYEGLSDPQDLIKYLENKTAGAFKSLGLSIPGTESILSWSPLLETMDWASEFIDIDGIDVSLKLPSPEFIKSKIVDLGLDLPKNLDIPDFPTISFNESFKPPEREELVVKKRKDWVGFELGKRSVAGTKASAYYEIRGSEDIQWAIANGRADVFLLNRTNNAIGAYAQAEVGPELLEASADIQVLGVQLYKNNWSKTSKTFTIEEELLGSGNGYSYNYEYTQQFAIGPIPVYISLGVYASSNAKLRAGLAFTQVYAELVPIARAGAFAEGAVGVKKVLAVGAHGNIDVLSLSAPLRGSAGLHFSNNGEPYLKLALTSDATLRAMSGGISAFVEYPWIKLCKKKKHGIRYRWPCIRPKRKSKTLYNYGGYAWSKSIMNWGLTYGYQGVQVSGSLLDQIDRREAAALKGKVDLYQRHLAMEDYSKKTELRIQSVFDKIKVVLEDNNTTLLPQKKVGLDLSYKNSDDNMSQYESWLMSTIDNNVESTSSFETKTLNSLQWMKDKNVNNSQAASRGRIDIDKEVDNSSVLRSLHGFLF